MLTATLATPPQAVGATASSDQQRASGPLAPAKGSAVAVAAVSGPSGSDGSFTASSLSAAGSWSTSGASGSFQWSYPLTVPPAATGSDVAPSVSLSYNSGSVDGQIATSNNQSSFLGEGWGYTPGYVERTYRSCADDTTLPSSAQTGDQCWAGQIVTLNLGGSTTELVQDDTSNAWHPANDNGARVELVGAPSAPGTYQGEYWRITTLDGIQYYFGLNNLPVGNQSVATQSAWTEPVYGAHKGDPCYNSNFASASCSQAWRWNLDYVVDPRANATAYYYTAEKNSYGADNNTAPVSYTRGGTLKEIDYGLRNVSNDPYQFTAPDKISFTPGQRCKGSACTYPGDFTVANASSWPDSPTDQYCPSTGTCNNHAPTFWSTIRTTSITTSLWTGSGTTYTPVDSYALGQSFPTDGDSELQLDSITRKGTGPDGSTIMEPPVTFTGQNMDSRVYGTNGEDEMLRHRMTMISTETGQSILISYNQSGQAKPMCTASTIPTDPSKDTTECFPVIWTRPLNTTPITDYFHKYVTTEVDVQDNNAIAPTRTTLYTYLGNPAWHYDNNEVVKPADRTWGQFRGYQKVEVRTGSTTTSDLWTLTRTTYYLGMVGNRKSDGTYDSAPTVPDSLGETVADNDQYADTAREVQTFNGDGGPELTSTITTEQTRATSATRARTGLPALTANVVISGITRAFTDTAAGGRQSTQRSIKTDSYGQVTQQTDTATNTDGSNLPAVCTTTNYDTNSGLWLRDRVKETITSQQSCPTDGSAPTPILTDVRTSYDSTAFGSIGSFGEPTETDTATDNTGGTLHFAKATAGFDATGRVTSATAFVSASDTTGRTTATSYATNSGGQLIQTVVTNPKNQTVTTTLDPGRAVPTEVVDVAAHTTDAAYDPLGRLSAVWKPGQVQGTDPATATYAYLLRTTGPLAVTTKTLIDSGDPLHPGTVTDTYRTAISLYDAFGALRQTQTDAPGGGRVITDSYTDSHGWVTSTNNRWFTSAAPSTTIVTTDPKGIASRTLNTYDGDGRLTEADAYNGNTYKWATKIVYSGDSTTTIPPSGGVETTSSIDARARTSELDQWTTPPNVNGSVISGGAAQTTTYGYTALGQPNSMTTASGTGVAATWTQTYDLAGRITSKTDPDAGASTTVYDNVGEVTSTTDANNQTLTYSYDALGRKTTETDTTANPDTKLASWTYDTLQAGQLTSSTRYTATGNYTIGATGYDADGNPTGTVTTLPTTETGFASSYTMNYTWTTTHLMATQTVQAAGGLYAETMKYFYDTFGEPTGNQGVNTYVSATSWDSYGEPTRYTLGVNNQTAWINYDYDNQTRRLADTVLSSQSAATAQLEASAYTYDSAGNTIRAVETEGGSSAPTETQCYGYNAVDQLTQAWSANDNCAANPTTNGNATVTGPQPYWSSWTIDAGGSRTKQVQHAPAGNTGGDTTTTYAGGVTGHTHALASTTTSGASTGSTSYTYNADGSTKTRKINGSTQTISDDPEGRTATITTASGIVSYINDASGNQLIRRDPTTTTLYLPGEELTRTISSGTITGTRYYSHNGTIVGERVGATNPIYIYTDPHGSAQVAVGTDVNGTLTPIRRYLGPYGNPLGTTTGGTWPDQHGFLNKPTDIATALTDIGARKYDPTTGRFTTVDPVVDSSSPEQSNGYSYSWNNPITHADPNGLDPHPIGGGCDGPCEISQGGGCDSTCQQSTEVSNSNPGDGDGQGRNYSTRHHAAVVGAVNIIEGQFRGEGFVPCSTTPEPNCYNLRTSKRIDLANKKCISLETPTAAAGCSYGVPDIAIEFPATNQWLIYEVKIATKSALAAREAAFYAARLSTSEDTRAKPGTAIGGPYPTGYGNDEIISWRDDGAILYGSPDDDNPAYRNAKSTAISEGMQDLSGIDLSQSSGAGCSCGTPRRSRGGGDHDPSGGLFDLPLVPFVPTWVNIPIEAAGSVIK